MEVVQVAYFNEAERRIAASAVEAKFEELSKEIGIAVDNYVWNLDQGMNHRGPHRLDVHLRRHVLRIYFTDRELAEYWGMEEKTIINTRLRELMARLHDLLQELDSQLPQDDAMADSDASGNAWFSRPARRLRWRPK